MTSTPAPEFSSSAFIAALAARWMPQATIAAPPAARRLALARPIPVVPVTKATLPSKSFIAGTPSLAVGSRLFRQETQREIEMAADQIGVSQSVARAQRRDDLAMCCPCIGQDRAHFLADGHDPQDHRGQEGIHVGQH